MTNLFPQPTYARMTAPSMIGPYNVLAFVADGVSSGFALLDMQDNGTGNPARFCVTACGYGDQATADAFGRNDQPEYTRWAGHYFETYGGAIERFACMAQNVKTDELRSAAQREGRA